MDKSTRVISCDEFERLIQLAKERSLSVSEVDDYFRHVDCCPFETHTLSGTAAQLGMPSNAFVAGSDLHNMPSAAYMAEQLAREFIPDIDNRSTVSPEAESFPSQQRRHRTTHENQQPIAGPIWIPKGPFCPTPVRLAARSNPHGVVFGEERDLKFTDPLPEPEIIDGHVPIVVTTPFRAQLEYVLGKEWRVALPLAPQQTRIVTSIHSRLYNSPKHEPFSDLSFARRLGGSVIGVADKTSSYASRLTLAASRACCDVEVCRGIPTKRDKNTLYLLISEFDKMLHLLATDTIDGFSMVEPFPTLAKIHFGGRYAETLLARYCTSASSGFCCVVLVPAIWADNEKYSASYDAFLRAVLKAICSLVTGKAIDAIAPFLEEIVAGIPFVKKHTHVSAKAIAVQAAISTVQHLTSHLTTLTGDHSARLLLPEVSSEAICAESEALCRHLSAREKEAFRRGMERLQFVTKALYDFTRPRRIFEELIQSEYAGMETFLKKVGLVEMDAQEAAANTLSGQIWTPASQSGPLIN